MDTDAIVGQFHEDGFVVLPQVFSRDEVDVFKRALDAFIHDVAPTLKPGEVYYEDTPDRPIKSAFHLEQCADVFASLLTDERLVDLARAIYDDPGVVLSSTMFFAKPALSGSVTPAHQDNAFQCWVPPEAMTTTIAVDASTCDNGVLVCQKGSHRLGILPHKPSGVMGFSQMLADPLDTTRYEEVEIHMNPGDVCVHAINTVHRSGPNLTNQPRHQLGICAHSSRAEVDEQLQAHRQAILAKLHADNT